MHCRPLIFATNNPLGHASQSLAQGCAAGFRADEDFREAGALRELVEVRERLGAFRDDEVCFAVAIDVPRDERTRHGAGAEGLRQLTAETLDLPRRMESVCL